MSTFNPGDRVRYVGGHPKSSDRDMLGKLGTVEETRPSLLSGEPIVSVKWDEGRRWGVYASNLRNLTGKAPGPFESFMNAMTAITTVLAPEPTTQDALRETADQAEQQARALQSVASASRRLADSIDRLEETSK